jgi:hypothetical protein
MTGPSETSRRTFLLLLLSCVATFLLALTWDLRPYPLSAGVDDSRYVLSAHYIKSVPWKFIHGIEPVEWLGPYDPTTLFKRPGFSIVLAVLSTLRLPYLQTVLLLNLVGLGIFANGLLRLRYPRSVVGAMVLVGGLLPTLYDANAVRLIREVATGALEVAILGVCVSLFTVKATRPVRILSSPAFLVLLPMLGLHWSMREEAVLLLPATLLIVNGALWVRSGAGLRHKLPLLLAASVVLLLPSQVAYLSFSALNHASYGLSIVNEVSEGSFPRAVNVLKRVNESPCDHGLLTVVEVEKVLVVSPSFRVVGETLRGVAAQKPDMTFTDAFSVMRISALQDETIRYSPTLTQDLFARIADEVEAACKNGLLHCGPPAMGGIVPLLCPSQWPLVSTTFVGYIAGDIAKLNHSGMSAFSSAIPGVSRLSPSQLAMFEEIAMQRMAGRDAQLVEYSQPASLEALHQQDIRRYRVGVFYQSVMPWLMGIGAVVLLVRLVFWSAPDRPWSLIILSALAGHVLVRAGVFSYLSTVDGYLNTRYISVCYPVAAVFAVLAPAELISLFWGPRTDQKTPGRYAFVPVVIALFVAAGFIYAGTRQGLSLPQGDLTALNGELTNEAGLEQIQWNGRRIQVLQQAQGWLLPEAGWLRGEAAVFDGWCLDVARVQPAQEVLIFADGQLVANSVPSTPFPQVESGLPEGRHAGFEVRVHRKLLAGKNVRVFALLADDRAGELHYPPSYPYSR